MHPTRKHHASRLWLATALLATVGAAVAQDGLTKPEVRAKLEAQGYTRVNDIEFDDGMWEADARSADGNRVQVRLDATSGEVFANELVANLGKSDIKAKLATAGYTNVHDVDYDNGMWKAEADDPAGKDVQVTLDPSSGRIVGKEKD